MTLLRPVLFACALAFACGGTAEDVPEEAPYSGEKCLAILDGIGTTLQQSVANGVLLPSAIPCGPDSVVNNPDSVDPGAAPRDVESVLNAFRDACGEYEAHCVTETPDGS